MFYLCKNRKFEIQILYHANISFHFTVWSLLLIPIERRHYWNVSPPKMDVLHVKYMYKWTPTQHIRLYSLKAINYCITNSFALTARLNHGNIIIGLMWAQLHFTRNSMLKAICCIIILCMCRSRSHIKLFGIIPFESISCVWLSGNALLCGSTNSN